MRLNTFAAGAQMESPKKDSKYRSKSLRALWIALGRCKVIVFIFFLLGLRVLAIILAKTVPSGGFAEKYRQFPADPRQPRQTWAKKPAWRRKQPGKRPLARNQDVAFSRFRGVKGKIDAQGQYRANFGSF